MEHQNDTELPELTPSELTALEECSDESVYAPGHIQPHGVLLTLQVPHLNILQVSENVKQFFDISTEALLGQPLDRLFSRDQVKQIADCVIQDKLKTCHPFELKIQRRTVGSEQQDKTLTFRSMLYRTGDELILELEPQSVSENRLSIPFFHRLQTVIFRLRSAANLTDLAQIIAQEIKAMTGFDRVMVYRFEADESGVVIGEAKESHLESYLGLHYPAIDIPVPARKLFHRNWLRYIPNINYTPAHLIPTLRPLADTPLDQSACVLRGVSPYHIEYLQNMGVAGSMTISLIDDNRLWGMISCHHYSTKLVDYETRKACGFLGQFASMELVHQQEQELSVYQTQVKRIQDKLQQAFLQDPNFIEQVLLGNTDQLLNLVNAQGAAILLDNQLTLVGQTPSGAEVEDFIAWLVKNNQKRVFATNSLSQLYPKAKQFKDRASGVLAISIRLSQVKQKSYHILWFRPEQVQTVNWAGKPQDAIAIDEIGKMRLCPRKSFELWKQTVREISYPWQGAELAAAAEMRNTLMLAVLEFSQTALEQAAERAAIASRAKSQFLAKMSHELRTPLNAILGFTQLMTRDRDTNAEFREHLNIINRSGQHLLTLINDVLEMSKIEAGQLILTESCFDLHRLIRSVKDMFALKVSEKGLNLNFERDATVPRYVSGDEAKLRQICINLLGNAVKFTATGSITLRLKALTLNDGKVIPQEYSLISQPSSQLYSLLSSDAPDFKSPIILHLEVEDTGCGIAPSDQESIFEAFMQTDRGRHAQGTGLGLSISRQFAQLMRGNITVRSSLNQGSTFTCQVVLHLAASVDLIEPETTRHVVSLEPGQPSYRILVAEDFAENRQLLVRLLESVGFEVCAVENGTEAIALWQEWHPHLIWMDIQMPVMDGYTATQQIRATATGKDVVIIALTASAFEEDRNSSFQVGCNDYISKPFTETELFDKMALHLGVRYRYAQDEPLDSEQVTSLPKFLTPEDLQVMSPKWIAQVYEAALELNDGRIYELIAQLPREQKPLADALKYLVDNFQLEAIANLTQP